MSKTAHRKGPAPLSRKANTVQIFSSKDLEQARKMVSQKLLFSAENKKAVIQKVPVPAPMPTCECASLAEENKRLVDGLMTQTRVSYRLKEDLRVMLERAQGYKDKGEEVYDELEVAEKQVVNLEKTLENEQKLACEREMTMQRQLLEVMRVHNSTVAALNKSEALVAALQQHVISLEAEREAALRREASSKARGVQLTACLEDLVAESEMAMAQMAKLLP